MVHFPDMYMYCSEDSKFLRTQMAYKVTVAFIISVVFVASRHNLNRMYIGLPVSLLSLANVYGFTK
jgi:hypothetical protein